MNAVSMLIAALGGLYAREIGKLMAPRLRQVLPVRTPFSAGADHINAGKLFRLLSSSFSALGPALSQRLRTPPPLRTPRSTAARMASTLGRHAVTTRVRSGCMTAESTVDTSASDGTPKSSMP